MTKDNSELIDELMHTFMNLKKIKFHNMVTCDGLTHNEKIVLFVLHDISKDSKVPLSALREKIKLAPSTITPIITLLEDKGLIERNIDKSDRRNIFLQISAKGEEHIDKVQFEVKKELSKYIKYMGEEDTKELIRLISKTINFFNGREENKI